jgi:hypothetical protein
VPNHIELTGLQGSHPLGALAAFGLLRCCEEMDGFRGARLGWRQAAGWRAVLRTDRPATAEELVSALAARQKGRADSRELNWARNIKTASASYRSALEEARNSTHPGERGYADFLAAFASEPGVDEDGQLEPTAFYMTSGRQEFLKEARTLAGKLANGVSIGRQKKTCEGMFREALLGPWRYEDPQHSLGWDPSTERLHALRAKSPTKEGSEGVTAAVWLAFEALPLFPCFLSEGRLATTGFRTTGATWRERVTYFSWPVWTDPVRLATVRSLLSLPDLTEPEPPLRELRLRGVEGVFRAERYKVKTQGAYYILRPAYPCL